MAHLRRLLAAFLLVPLVSSCGARSHERQGALPAMQWDFRPESDQWTGATLSAIARHGRGLTDTVPADIRRFCPRYPRASAEDRAAFWAGLMSSLAKYESTWRPEASGGGGQWIGLLQIAPGTAQAYGCRATNRAALKNGSANLSCGVRIASAQVSRDAEIVGRPGAWRGLARDWAPFRSRAKVDAMADWTRRQSYCR